MIRRHASALGATVSAAAVLALAILVVAQQPGRAETAPAEASPPRPEILMTLASSDDPETLVRELPVPVESISTFVLEEQRFRTYIPGAPAHVNAELRAGLSPEDPVWLRLPPGGVQQALQWESQAGQRQQVNATSEGPRTLQAPAPGGLTVGVTGTASLQQLVEAQPFRVAAVLLFDALQQRYLSWVAGAPEHVDTLSGAGALRADSIVWLRRSFADGPSTPTTPTPSAAPAAPSSPSVPSSPSSPAETEAAPAPSGTPSATPTGTPTATPAPTSTPAPSSTPAAGGGSNPVRSGAGLLRHTTYEPGSSTREESHTSTSHALGTTSTARTGERAGVALLKPGDPSWRAGGYRAEWHAMDHISGPGAERWQGISFYFPKDYNQGSNSRTWDDRIIFQYTDEGSPMFSLHLDADRQQLWLRRKTSTGGTQRFEELGRWSFNTEQWYDLVFHAKWTNDSSGVFEVYVDGDRKVSYRGRTLAIRNVTYSKWGIYGQPTRLFFDEVRIAEGANRMADVTP